MKRHYDIHLNPKNPAPHLSRKNADFNEGYFKNMCLSFFSQHVNTYKLLNYRSSCSALYTTEMLPQSERDVSLCHLKTRCSFFHKDEALQDPCFINWGYYFFRKATEWKSLEFVRSLHLCPCSPCACMGPPLRLHPTVQETY